MSWANLHTGNRCGQAIPAGVHGMDITAGQRVSSPDDGVDMSGDVQFAAEQGGFVIIRKGILVAWADMADPALLCLAWTGQPASCADIAQAIDELPVAPVAGRAPVSFGAELHADDALDDIRELAAEWDAGSRCLPHRCALCDAVTRDTLEGVPRGVVAGVPTAK